MDFFEHQAQAKRSSAWLVGLLMLAVVALIAITSVVIVQIVQHSGYVHHADGRVPAGAILTLVSIVVIGVVSLGGALKWYELRSGGAAIARRLGGRAINTSAQDACEKRVLNVVEEMALASGMPVPTVYVLDDLAINAFAAGLTPQDAVIGITRGALEALNRDELQGVIAHEFSHILHGDMRLNTHLVAALHGLLLLGLIGSFLLRYSPRSRRSSKGGDVFAPIILAGLALWLLGYVGTFFGQMIRAAVSRQREYLADASAVQYTRYPQGIAGALNKIANHQGGSAIQASHAQEFSHLFFASAVSGWFAGLWATHPPLNKRLDRLLPGWRIVLKFPSRERRNAQPLGTTALANTAIKLAVMDAAINAIGEPQPAHLLEAKSTLAHLPKALKEAAYSTEGAQTVLYGLLLDSDPQVSDTQLQVLRANVSLQQYLHLLEQRETLAQLPATQRLPLLDLLLASLKPLSTGQRSSLLDNLKHLIRSDGHVSLGEWTVLRIVERYLRPAHARYGRLKLAELSDECVLALSVLARVGNDDETLAQAAFERGARSLDIARAFILSESVCNLRELEAALRRLNQLNPLHKPQLFKAMAKVVEHDARVTPAEAELLRALADILDCPMPPLLSLGT